MVFIAVVQLAAGRSISDDSLSTRIVSLVPNTTEILFAIDAGKQVVGVSDFCKFPAEAAKLPHVGGLTNPSLEPILQLRPSCVLLYRSQKDFAARLGQLGISTQMLPVDTLNDLEEAILQLGILTGKQVEAAALKSTISRSLANVQSSTLSTTGPVVTGMVIVSRDPSRLSAIFQASFLNDIFELAGGKLAMPGPTAISTEDIIHANPQVIIDLSGSSTIPPDEIDLGPVKDTGPWAVLNTVGAVKTGHVYRWNDPHILLLGPSVIESASGFQKMLTDVKSSSARLDIPE